MSVKRSILVVAAIFAAIASLTRFSQPSSSVHLIELPGWNAKQPEQRESVEHALVELRDNRAVFLNHKQITLNELDESIRDLEMHFPIVLLRAESEVPQAFVLQAFKAIAKAGVYQSRLRLDPSNLARHRVFDQAPFEDSDRSIPQPITGNRSNQPPVEAGDCETLTLPPPLY